MMNACISHYLVLILAFVDRFGMFMTTQYTFIDTLTSWENAKNSCSNKGLTLAIFDTEQKMDELFALIKHNYASGETSPEFWIGMHWDSIYRWIDGRPPDYGLIWRAGEQICSQLCCCFIDYNRDLNVIGLRSGSCDSSNRIVCSEEDATTSHITTLSTIQSTDNGVIETSTSTKTTQQTTSFILKSESTIKQIPVSTDNGDKFTKFTTDTTGGHITNGTNFSSTRPAGSRVIVFCPIDAVNFCDCTLVRNLSQLDLGAPIDHLYKIDKKKTSAYIRKHNSAYDRRFSAKVMGLTASAVLVIVGLSVCCLDMTRIQTTKKQKLLTFETLTLMSN